MNKISALLMLFFGITLFSYSQTVTIGSQVWTIKNLDVSTFRNGALIKQAKTDEEWMLAGENKQAAWCYYNNDAGNGTKYGKLYNWYAVNDARGLAPLGYHIPTDKEWILLSDSLMGLDVAGSKMKSSTDWIENGNGNNSSGFSGLPGGCRYSYGGFGSIGEYGAWWSAFENLESYFFGRSLNNYDSNLMGVMASTFYGFSVRCIRD